MKYTFDVLVVAMMNHTPAWSHMTVNFVKGGPEEPDNGNSDSHDGYRRPKRKTISAKCKNPSRSTKRGFGPLVLLVHQGVFWSPWSFWSTLIHPGPHFR